MMNNYNQTPNLPEGHHYSNNRFQHPQSAYQPSGLNAPYQLSGYSNPRHAFTTNLNNSMRPQQSSQQWGPQNSEELAKAAKRRHFMEQQRKMKDFRAITQNQLDADVYANSLFNAFPTSSYTVATPSVNVPSAAVVTVQNQKPPDIVKITSKDYSSIVTPQPSAQLPSVKSGISPKVSIKPPQKSLDEVMLSLCNITSPEPKQRFNVVSKKSRVKENQVRKIPHWLTEEGRSSLPSLYQSLLQFVCADTSNNMPDNQKVYQSFSQFGVDYSRCSSILLLARRTLPGNQLTKREYIEALALVILSKQGVSFGGIDYLLTLSSAPLPDTTPFPLSTTQAVVSTSPQIRFSQPVQSNCNLDFEEDEFQSFQSATNPVGIVDSCVDKSGKTDFHFQTTLGKASETIISSGDKYAAFRGLEIAKEFSPQKSDNFETSSMKGENNIVFNNPSLINQSDLDRNSNAFDSSAISGKNEKDVDDWADFSAISFQKAEFPVVSTISHSASNIESEAIGQNLSAMFNFGQSKSIASFPSTEVGNSHTGHIDIESTNGKNGQAQSIPSIPTSSGDISNSDTTKRQELVIEDFDIWGDEPMQFNASVPVEINSIESEVDTVNEKSSGIQPVQPEVSSGNSTVLEGSFKPNYDINLSSLVAETSSSSQNIENNDSQFSVESNHSLNAINIKETDNKAIDSGNAFLTSTASKSMYKPNLDSFMEGPPDISAFGEPPTPPPMVAPLPEPSPIDFERNNAFLDEPPSCDVTESSSKPSYDIDLEFFSSLEMPPSTVIPQGDVKVGESLSQWKPKVDNSCDTNSVSSLELSKLPGESETNRDSRNVSPNIVGIAPAASVPVIPDEPDSSKEEDPDEFADFCHADSLTSSKEPPTNTKNMADFPTMPFDEFESSIHLDRNENQVFKNVPSFSVFGMDIQETNVAPALFGSNLNTELTQKRDMDASVVIKRCVVSASNILHQSFNAFNAVKPGSETIMEAMCTKRGRNYISSIRELCEFIRRLKNAFPIAVPQSDPMSKDIKEEFDKFDVLWSSLVSLLPQHIADVLVTAINFENDNMPSPINEQSYEICSLCLSPLNLSPEVQISPLSSVTVEDPQHNSVDKFHAICGNFWLNCVETKSNKSKLNIPRIKLHY